MNYILPYLKNMSQGMLNERITATLIVLSIVSFICGGQIMANTLIVSSHQEDVQVTGIVVDKSDNPLLGVSVVEKGTTNGAITDVEGRFKLTLRGNNPILVFSYIGFTTSEVVVGNKTSFHIKLSEDVKVMDEVVVIGYGTTTKKEVTGSVSSLKNDDFKQGNITDPIQLLQGQIAGLNIVRPNGGDPNGDFEVQLRGLTTLAGGAGPLIVIDGVSGGNLSSISPDDIESIDVLKDGSAAAIYGTRGTNGVILVTTKKAKSGKSVVEFSSYIAMQKVAKKPDVLSASEFRQVIKDFFPTQEDAYDYGTTTDWFDEVTRKNPVSQHYNLSTSGGTNELNYRANISWFDDQGLVSRSNNTNLRARMNVGQTGINNRLNLNYTLSYATGKKAYSDNYVLRQATLRNPTEPVYDTKNETPVSGGYYYNDGPFEYYNPVALLNEMDDDGDVRDFTGSVNASFKLFEGLKINALGALNQTNERYGHYYGKYYPIGFGNNGYAEVYNNMAKKQQYETSLDFQKTYKGHKVQAIAGYSYNSEEYENYYSMNYKFDTDLYSFYNIGAGSALADGKASMSSSKTSNKLIAFFGRVMYNYKEKYLLSTSVRYEGSSRFGTNNKWGTFPALSLGWRLSEEPFIKNLSWIQNLKLRAGFGVTGNQDIGDYKSLQILTKGSNFYYDNSWVSTYQPASNPNPDLKWEKKEELNFGLDFSVLDSRLNVSLDYYRRRTKDLLYTYTVPVPPNLYSSKFTNVGTIDNNGFEMTVNATPVKIKNFKWNLTATFSRNKNKLVSFSNNDYAMVDIKTGYFGDDLKVYTERIVEGGAIGNFWGPKFLGFDKNGDNIFEDVDKNGKINDSDNQVIGNAYPDFTFSLSNSFVYKNFDLSFLLRGSVGNDVLNQSRVYYEGFGYFGSRNILRSTLDNAEYKGAAIYSSRFVEDGSYLKLDNLTIGYTIPFKSKFISRCRVYLTGQNLLTVTGYKGIDPEVSLSGLEPGIDWYDFYPRSKTYVFGLNVTF